MRAEVLGVRLIAANHQRSRRNGPIRVVEVPLTPGLTSLAGLNGAGKSRVLAGVAAALSGTPWGGGKWQLLVRLTGGDSHNSDLEDFLSGFFAPPPMGFVLPPDFETDPDAVRRAADQQLAEYYAERADHWREWLRDVVLEGIRRTRPDGIGKPEPFADAITQQAAFAITLDDGEPAVALALDRRTENPELRALLTTLDTAWQDVLAELRDQLAEEPPQSPGEFYEPIGEFGREWYLNEDPATSAWHPPYAGDRLPVPLHPLTDRHWRKAAWPIKTVDVDQATDVAALTHQWLSELLANEDDVLNVMSMQQEEGGLSPLEAVRASEVRVEAHLDGVGRREPSKPNPVLSLDVLAMSASRHYAALTGGELRLTCRLRPVATWLGPGESFEWLAVDPDADGLISINSLSRSQLRWARFAIAAALHQTDVQPSATTAEREWAPWLFIDEPESGVHRAGERRLAAGLRELTDELGASIVIATHSPHMVSRSHAAKVVKRDADGNVAVDDLPAAAADVAATLGLEVTDLLGWYEQVLFVEGAHDEALIRAFLEEDLDQTRTLLVPIRGVKDAGQIVDARLLDFVDGPAIMLIDGLGTRAADSWKAIAGLALAGNRKAAHARARSDFSGHRHEERFLRECAERLLRDNTSMSRFTVQALGVDDIVELLPTKEVLGTDITWVEARARHKREASRTPFKDWLVTAYRCRPISVTVIKHIAESMDTVPDDVALLAESLRDRPDSI